MRFKAHRDRDLHRKDIELREKLSHSEHQFNIKLRQLVDLNGPYDRRMNEKFDVQLKRRLEKVGLATDFEKGGPFHKLAD